VGVEPYFPYSATIPHLLFAVYQMMFAIITPAIISGAVVERMSFRSYVIFLLIWSLIIYNPIAHWVWSAWEETGPDGAPVLGPDGNPILKVGWIRGIGALDFAGGTVVHMSSGYSAFVACLFVGKRKDTNSFMVHNVPFVLLGAAMLWFGWFGFNSGSALAANGLAAYAFTNTQVATGAAFITWVILDSIVKKQVTATGAACGSIVGLVGITPAAGFVHPASSLAIGSLTVIVCYFTLEAKAKWLPRILPQADDTLDVFSCHGVGGTMGCILTGFFASTEVNPGGANGVFFGGPILLAYQLAAIGITLAYSLIGTALILLALKCTKIGLAIESEDGLDVALHGTKAYIYEEEKVAIAQSSSIKLTDWWDSFKARFK